PELNNSIKLKTLYIAGAILFLLIATVSLYFTGGEFIPRLNEGTLSVQFIRPLTINTEQSLHLEKLSHEKILEFKEVKLVFGRIGTPEVTVHPAGIYHGDTIIMLNDPSSWPLHHGKKYTYEELSKAINDKLVQSIPGQRLMMTQPIELRFNELLEGVKSDISLLIFGEDMEKLENYSKNAAEIIEKINGAGNVEVELRGKTAMLQVIPKIDVLSRYGIPKSTVLDTVSIAIGGIEAGHFYKGVRRFPIIIRLPENIRTSIQSLKQTPVGIGENNSVPLSSLATLKVVDVYNAINRDSSRRRAAVLINPKGRDTVSFVNEAKKKIEKNLKLPPGYFIEWGGNFKNLQSAKERLYIIVPICLALVFFIIYSAFGKIWQTVLLFSTVPLAIAGGTINLFIMGLPFSISAIIGFIALTGIAVLHSLVLVSYYNKLSTEGEEGINLIKKGAMLRLRPVMMTALTDILGFLPMMLATGTGAEVQKPLATVVVGGVIVSTIVTLVLIPVLYNLIEKKIAIKSIEQ
ncbi:MAG: efflux RND transporter permease subunit, partial [Bacteroidales bacterium]|nr:efflux RND transporter permease subunit [Bacteroidales bacterium]